MSIESAKAFIEKVKTDKEFSQKAAVCKDAAACAAMAKNEGFDFTENEIHELTREMSVEELDSISGGRIIESGPNPQW